MASEEALRTSIAACLRTFFQQGWCLGSSGAMAALVGSEDFRSAPMLVTPSGVPKEQLDPDDLFLLAGLNQSGQTLKEPVKQLKVSDSKAIFSAVFEQRKDVRAICHIHSVAAVLAADASCGGSVKVKGIEMIKGLGVPGDGILELPVIPNKATEPELVPDVLQVLKDFPAAPAILVRGHGAYVFGVSLEKAKIAAECLGFILDVEERKRRLPQLEVSAKRRRLKGVDPAVVLLDVEGTTTPISFVKEKLFPYAAAAVGSWTRAASAAELSFVVSSFQKQCQEDKVPFNADAAAEEVERLAKDWIAKDRKVAPLKDLQGRLWRSGYEAGELKGEMFEDTPQAMARWVAEGRRVAIFSSGSREAQRLIFQHSDKGDLTEFISAYFDPKAAMASKQESKAYEEIALSLGIDPQQGLFCTDVLGEAQAASKAGWHCMLSLRPGNAPLADGHGFRAVTSLLDA